MRKKDDKHKISGDPQSDFSPPADHFIAQVEGGLIKALSQAAACEPEFIGKVEHKCLLALSGGPDSTALLLAVSSLRGKLGLDLSVCHVNHHLRGEESDADEQFCVELTNRLSVPFSRRHIERLEPKGQRHASEASLREARYAALSGEASAQGAGFILVGHTLDDQVETLLFRLLRGTGPAGLVGMEPARRLDERTVLIRPMLSVRRADCLSYLEREGQDAVSDSSNESREYTRNYIRQVLIPPIRERFPGFESRLDQLRQLITEDELLLAELTGQALEILDDGSGCNTDRWLREPFQTLPASLKRRALADSMTARRVEVSFERVQAILEICERGGAISLNGSWDLRVEERYIDWVEKTESDLEEEENASNQPIEVRIPGLTIAPQLGKALRVETWSESPQSQGIPTFPDRTSPAALVDLSQAKLPLVVRIRRSGDQIRPFGMNEPVKLKKFLHTKKAGADERKYIIVVADQEEIIWVPGVGLSNKVRVDRKPTHRLSWLDIKQDEGGLC